jgi:hypothetical protein
MNVEFILLNEETFKKVWEEDNIPDPASDQRELRERIGVKRFSHYESWI